MVFHVLMVIFGYVSGSIPFGKIISYRYGVDIQKRGSGNIGFANVLRILGWRAAVPVVLLDTLKGLVPTVIATIYFDVGIGFLIGMCAILGHVFPIWLRFKGGKGVATGLGVLLGTTPLIGCIGLLVYIIGSNIFKNSGHASIAAGITVFISGSILFSDYIWAYVMLILIMLWTLRKNLFGTVPNYDN